MGAPRRSPLCSSSWWNSPHSAQLFSIVSRPHHPPDSKFLEIRETRRKESWSREHLRYWCPGVMLTLSLKDTDPPSPTPHPYPKQFLQPNPSQEPQTLPTASASLPTIFAPPLYLSVGPARRSHGPRCLPHHVGVTVLEARGHVPPPPRAHQTSSAPAPLGFQKYMLSLFTLGFQF